MRRYASLLSLFLAVLAGWSAPLGAQLVCLPAPRLLTVFPMGGRQGTTVEVAVTGENLEEADRLFFSSPQITAEPKTGDDGAVVPGHFVVKIAPETPSGVYEARAVSRLGVSSSRAFCVGNLPEVVREAPAATPATAFSLEVNTLCNAVMTKRAVDYYSFTAAAGERLFVECAAAGIDSRLVPVLIVADEHGRDLLVDRTSGALEFTAPAAGRYLLKVHSLTFQGGPGNFYRLALTRVPENGLARHQPGTQAVSAFSWHPAPDLESRLKQVESTSGVQAITLPCELLGKFYPAAHVDTFEFTAKKGEVWWVEVASARLGLPTDPFIVVQQVTSGPDGQEVLKDVVELNDISSPVKISSNGYSYDGPPYNAGSADVLGEVKIPADGKYRLKVRDLFGGTRTDARNIYYLSIRPPQPDFALVAWALHMNLRNGDRAALSKPLALRQGATMPLEVIVIRRDGFDGEIELGMEGLPPGITACGLKIPAGKSRGILLVSAAPDAPATMGTAQLFGRATIAGTEVKRTGSLASMTWPVKDASQEIPVPRLVKDVVVSATDAEPAPVTIAPADATVFTAPVGGKLKIPLRCTWHGDFTGTLKLKAFGDGFEAVKEFDLAPQTGTAEALLDLAELKAKPGEYTIAFYGSIIARYREAPDVVKRAEEAQKKAEQACESTTTMAKRMAEAAKTAPAEKKAELESAAAAAAEQAKLAEAKKMEAGKRMKAATDGATPKDTVDIVVSEPIHIRVAAAAQP